MALRTRPPINIGLVFDWHARKRTRTVVHLDRPFDIAPDAGTTYGAASLAEQVVEVSNWLYAAGLRHGDRLAVVKDNHFDMVLIAAGAARIGALPVMMAPVQDLDAVRTMIARADPTVLVAGAGVLERAAAAGVAPAGPGVRLVVIGEPREGPPPGAVTLDDLRGAADAPVRVRGDHEPMIVTHTSGTTGVPKLVMHSPYTALGALPYRLESSRIPLLTSGRGDVVASAISFCHMRGLSWTRSQFALAPRAMVVISDPGLESTARVLAKHRPTSLEALPNVFQRWEELADGQPELFFQVRRFISTFDAVHPRTVRTFLGLSRARFPVWAWGLGQSEIAGISANLFTRGTVRGARTTRDDVTNVGWPTLVRVKVVDPDTGRRLPRGEPGLLMVNTRTRCLDYLGESDRHRMKTEGDWWNTGDLGERTAFGRVRLVDREVDMIPGMSCIEAESTLLDRLERAQEVVVLGVPDGLPVPVLCMRDDRLDPGEWKRATEGLPDFGEPRLVPWEDVPRTATWKVRRVQLREQLLGEKSGRGTGRWT
ncbi:putative fatty-acid-CoA ligase FadD [Streptomyces camponoticapitis]|uniref:Fatty-acid-CoA ligase FadD n=1 Tax=Streptomyces camponoticapitis TaxID=1616125 RepID=A0ABQ2E827_9ACTN|nr:class I adenylate-forming enzyme family protein [Streptomyces camponoticapitis]GGJ96801.1 putative fatty-acid-CoA ligase FadD [Streptomyces camponoticapitis]